jgi:hypothetical protein
MWSPVTKNIPIFPVKQFDKPKFEAKQNHPPKNYLSKK